MAKAKILLAEDESIWRMDLKEMLTEAGYEVVGEAGDGEKAVELAHSLKPDLIIMDIKMPKMNGLKAGRIITRSVNVPILLLTAYSQQDLVAEAKQAHVTGYLVKPVRESDLIPAVEISLAQARKVAALEQNISKLQHQIESRKLVERAKGVLMNKHRWSEEQAYQTLRKNSMNRRISMDELARRILAEEQQV
ncbi:ANTAR domain-containing response regulator [Paenactinomyces guangxiensis]|uniref:Response regulator n=1 Tax=Paenactinomyces guangxiensis TaxID=1490290 RepID=A0A7W2A8V0_9BACL|nr:response regulator [Paenactinomyces guangxiensis]MBA4494584.1 response regulator [Paenactinomyces guangxiensis]MBH8591653.1 response regulator [Paenactinomyces guangxiensis]